MSKINRLKLAKMLLKFGQIETEQGVLVYEGELAEGLEVFIEQEGELVPAPDGEYKVEKTTYVVKEGVISEIKVEEVEKEEELEDESVDKIAELESKIAELEAVISERDEIIKQRDEEIAELKSKISEQEEKLKMSTEKPAKDILKDEQNTNNKEVKVNKALRFFQ